MKDIDYKKIGKILEIGVSIFLVIDVLVTIWAIHTYETRALKNYYHEEITIEEDANWFIQLKNK